MFITLDLSRSLLAKPRSLLNKPLIVKLHQKLEVIATIIVTGNKDKELGKI